ncbi:hypothetical protein D3C72_1072290 [compost metagenome]
MARAHEVSRNHFLRVDEVDLLVQIGVQRHVAQVLVHLFTGGSFLKVEVENGHRHVWRRNADRVTGQLAGQLRQGLGSSGGSTGLGDDHVQRGATATAIALVEVVDQVLVVGVRVNGFDVTVDDAELVIHSFQHRHDGVGGAGSGGHDLVVSGDFVVVDAVNDVLQLAFARRGENNAGDTRALQVLAQTIGVTPYTGVVHQQRIFDAVLGVIHLGRVLRVDHLDQVTVGGDGVVFFVDGNGAVERTMDRIATQQAGALGQVVVGAFAHDDGAQTQAVATTGFLDQDARQQAADTTEAVKHNVGAFTCRSVLLTNNVGHFFTHELLGATAVAFQLEFVRQLAQVDRSGAQFQLAHGFEQRECLVDREFGFVGLAMTSKAVRFEDRDHRTVDQAAAIDRAHHIVIAVELTDKRDHRFCKCFTINPLTKTLVGLLSHGNLPHVGTEKRGYIMTPRSPSSNERLSPRAHYMQLACARPDSTGL